MSYNPDYVSNRMQNPQMKISGGSCFEEYLKILILIYFMTGLFY
jgi:hypothetical protein